MKKYLFLAVVILAITLMSSLLLPMWLSSRAEMYLSNLGASNVHAEVDAAPSLRLLLGQADTLKAEAKDIVLGKLVLSDAAVDGENVQFDAIEAYTNRNFKIISADRLVLTGQITADTLSKFLAREYDKLENIQVEMHPDGIYVTAEARLLKSPIRIYIEGELLEETENIYLHLRRIDIKNASFGRAAIAGFFDDIPLVQLKTLPLRAEVRKIEQAEGYVKVVIDCKNE
ncbi:hypothetical protein TAMA11512_13610 [Selenomonas sp. TAMA-11512]|uniref:LmeA family phospholipid-binding protein n=1 Tax=Selenomonas sp. TAMA-11512 TaxID=3095337 RepID=UPI00308A9A53|nr:hypothetical protein TAMA11512_13610 [Selenomonas sp. TAMA-11512]